MVSAEDNFCKTANCVISYTGSVSCIPPCTHSTKCLSDYKRWPFDTQNCSMHIGAWVHSGDDVDYELLKSNTIEKDVESQNRLWRLVATTVKRNEGNYSTKLKNTYPSITYSFLMQRHSAQHAAVFVVPAISKYLPTYRPIQVKIL